MEQDQAEKHRGRVARAVKAIGIILLSMMLALYVLLPFGMGVFAAIRPARAIESPPEGYGPFHSQRRITRSLHAGMPRVPTARQSSSYMAAKAILPLLKHMRRCCAKRAMACSR